MTHSFAGCLLALVIISSPVRADYFYLWSADTPTAFSDHSGMQVHLTAGGNPVGATGPVSGDQSVVAATLSTFINPGVTGTDTFSQGQGLALGLTVADGTSSGKVSFSLGVSGSLSADGSNHLIYSFLNGLSRDLTVNGHQYLISVNPSITSSGNILATIAPAATGSGGSGSPSPSNAPEPSALVLAASGAGSLVVYCRRLWGRLRSARLVA
jgi:hypothetical protein